MNTRRSTGYVALVLCIVVAVFGGLISPVAADDRGVGEDVVLTLKASDLGMDPVVLRDVVSDLQEDVEEHGGLEQLLKATVREEVSSEVVDTSQWPDFDGSVAMTSDNAGMAFTIPAGEVTTSLSWRGIAATLIALAAGYGIRVLCISGMIALGVAAATYPVICTPLQGVITGILAPLLTHAFNKTLGTPEATRDIIIGGLLGLAVGVLWEKYLSPWAKNDLSRHVGDLGTWIRGKVPWVNRWLGSSAADGTDAFGHQLEDLTELLDEAMRDWGGLRPSSVRLLPVGDSITFGVGSSDFNGYREDLYDALGRVKLKPDFVGTQSSGDMSDPQHEGNRGWLIDQIANAAADDVKKMRPNVVTLMAGTNDIQKDERVATAPDRLNTLIDRVQAGSPGVAIAVATLVPVKGDPPAEARREAYNARVRSLVAERRSQGEKVGLAEMGPMTDAMLADRLHPNDIGYDYMAKEFYDAVMKMIDVGWVLDPAGVDPDEGNPGTGMCVDTAGGWKELGRIARGPINPDSSSAGVQGQVRLADFDGNGKTDYAVVTDTGAVYLWTKITGGWVNRGKVAAGNGVAGRGTQVRFADIDGDLDDDYLVVHDNGSVEAWRNDDAWINGGSAWHAQGTIAAGTGTNDGADIRFADIDGDLDDDYLVVHDDGSIDAWLNDDVLADGGAWRKLGRISGGVGYPGSKVRLTDLDGDKDADYLIVHSDGSTEAWLNRSVAEDLREGWKSIGKIATGTGTGGEAVQFADADADRDADYFVIGSAGTATWWENAEVATREDKENGFKKVGVYGDHKLDASNNARSVTFADLDGDGDDDYLLVGPKGEVEAWRNDDVAPRGSNAWIRIGRVAEGVSPGRTERVVFADINGDGRDDYLVVDDTNGRVRGWRNDGPFTKGITAWTGLGVIAQGPAGAGGKRVQFADVDGDGDDDYLLVSVDHSVHAWKNLGTDAPGGGGWAAQGLLAQPQSAAVTQETVFANMNCDKRADYVLRDPGENNALYGWTNLGGFGNQWSEKKKIAYGVAMSFPVEVHLADLDGDGLDDYLVVDPTNGATRAWLNNGGNQANP